MNMDNKTIIIFGIIVIGVLSLLTKNNEIAATSLGGIIGYLTQDIKNNQQCLQ